MKTHIHFWDNLRTFMVFLVILIHAGLVYEAALESTWIVIDPVKNNNIGLVRLYLDLFVMYTLFFISGYFIQNSVKTKSAIGFLKAKFSRIMIPWVISVLLLIPAYKAIFLYSRHLPQEALFTYFHWFQRLDGNPYSFSDNPVQNWLWFLPVLFLFQVVYLALSRIKLLPARFSLRTGVFLTVFIGLLYSMIISVTGLTGWHHSLLFHFQRERLLVYFLVFLLGDLCYQINLFESEDRTKTRYVLSNAALAITLTVYTIVALNLFFNMIAPGRNFFFVSPWIDTMAFYSSQLISMLLFIYILIGMFRSRFNKRNNLMDHLNQNSYYVYIIHMIVLGVIALVTVELPFPVTMKYLLLTLLTFSVSHAAVYGIRKAVEISRARISA